MWARELGRMSGVSIPLHACEHMYIVTQAIAGVTPDLPVLRDQDGHVYVKEEVGGLLMGGFDPWAKPWGTDRIPEPFIFQTLKEDWEKFEILMTNAVQRLPTLEHAEVRTFLNGPESFTPDNYFILGEAPEVRRYYVGAGFCSGGIAAAGGPRRLRGQDGLGARQLVRPRGRRARAGLFVRPPELVPLRGGRAPRRPRGGSPLRPDLVRQAAGAGAGRRGAPAVPLRQRRGGVAGPHRVHRHAERAGRLRERPHRDARGPGRLSGGHRLRPAHARPRLDPPSHAGGRAGHGHRRDRGLGGARAHGPALP